MKRFIIFIALFISVSFVSMAKKDINAWKNEVNLEQQFITFKKNLNYWNGSYFLEPLQMNQFYGAFMDSISAVEKNTIAKSEKIASLQSELSSDKSEIEELKVKLQESIDRENSFVVMGININKNVYTLTLYGIIIGVLILAAFAFLMFKRSNAITTNTKKEYEELKEEFETHRKNSLERYVQINKELHNARMELKNK